MSSVKTMRAAPSHPESDSGLYQSMTISLLCSPSQFNGFLLLKEPTAVLLGTKFTVATY
jgi:hypothetical protein